MTDPRIAEEKALVEWLREAVGELLELEPHEVDPDRPLTELGLSSRDGVGLVGELEDHLDRDLDATMIFETPTISLLVRKLIFDEDPPKAQQPLTGVKIEGAIGAAVKNGDFADDDAIAVVGVGCRLPGGVHGPRQLWEFLLEGGDAIRKVPEDRWEQFTPPGANAAAVLQGLNRWGGFLDEISGFDAEFFGISPREAELMDPQQRMLLEVSWEALEDAGIAPASLRGTSTGVYIGMSGNEYSHLTTKHLENVDAYVSTGSALSIASNRLSYLLDLRGPSMTVDTACSSSLVAMHQASKSIASGEITTAIVGGVNLVLAPAISFTFAQAGALAPDGRIKAFSEDADGMVRAEGCGVVILKRLSDARRDGNHILSVIRGSAVNQDGRSNGITAPNPLAQSALLENAYERVGIDPHTVDYIEAHGTGTLLGDPIEAGALGTVLGGEERGADKPLLLGSAKSNFGHLEAAAGVVGFIKLVLSLYHGQIPPSINYAGPNPHIKWEQDHISVVTEATDWPRYGGLARAGVSAFGFGGTNAHVILEESGDRNRRLAGPMAGEDEQVTTFLFSAAQEGRVRAAAAALAPWLETPAGRNVALRDVAHTLARTRVPGRVRGSVTARGRDALVLALKSLGEGLDAPNVVAPDSAMAKQRGDQGVVWIFSGYGSTWNGMGRKLLEEEPAFAAAIDELESLFVAEAGFSLREAITVDQDLRDSTKAQIALYGMQVALAALWRAHGVEPAAVIGHSMGEIAAAVVAGALSPADGVRVITHRSIVMERENLRGVGGMAVLQASPEEFEAVADQFPGVTIAVYGSPKAITIAGPKEPLNAAAEYVKGLGRNAWVLPVGGAGHSSQVDRVLEEFAGLLEGITPLEPTVPFYSSSSGTPTAQHTFDIAYWQRNMRNPVEYMQAITAAAADGFNAFLEVSPHPVGEITARQTLKAAGVENRVVIPTLRRDGDDGVSFRTSLAALHAWHLVEDLDQVVLRARKVALPFWQHRRFWLDDKPSAALGTTLGHPLLGVHVELPEGDRHLWKADVGTASLPWLRDHRVHGAPVVSAAAFAEIALAAAAHAFTDAIDPVTLTDLSLDELLILSERTEITTSLTLIDDTSARVDVFSRAAEVGAPMVRRATADLRRAPAEVAQGVPADRSAEHASGTPFDVAALAAESGLKHGPAFGGLADPRRHEDGTVTARVAVPLAALADRHYRVHPALIDACLQAVGAAGSPDGSADRPFFVSGVGSLALPGDPQRGGTVTAATSTAEDGTPSGGLVLVGDDGTTILELSGIMLRTVAVEEIPEEAAKAEPADAFGEGRTLIEALRTSDPAGARALLARRLLERVAAVMAHDPDELDVDAPLTELGFDSLMAVRAKGTVEQDLGIEIPTKLLLQGGCLADLEEGIARELGLADAAPRRVSLVPRSQRYIEPRDATERWIAAIWEEVLEEGPLSATADFDELGGDTAAVESIITKMRERLGDELDSAEVFAHRSIEKQADLLRDQVEGNNGNPVRVLQAGGGENPPLFLFHPAGGPTSVYQNLVELLDRDQAVYGFERLEGLRHIEEKAAHYIAMIRDIAPHGPYRLAGWSLGGVLAYEVAQQLKAAGEEIDLVAMIDTTIPKPTPGVTERDLLKDRFERFFAYMSETYDIPIDIDIEALVELDEDAQVALMMNIVEDAGLGMSKGVLEHQRTSYIDARIAERYVAEPFDGKIVLYRATDRGLTTTLDPRYDRDEEALGWDDFTADLEIVHVQGTHISCIDRPGVETMAAHMREALKRAPATAANPEGAL
ncbi:MAG: beta-ketoacyl synthase N-terminal-like domain-containing protein [Solirubrobacteraceae bacterium]|nr:beta-ketoacyl synthase N-terminal-like domain-containing protein [Solirubrobacteraceae bacterium]